MEITPEAATQKKDRLRMRSMRKLLISSSPRHRSCVDQRRPEGLASSAAESLGSLAKGATGDCPVHLPSCGYQGLSGPQKSATSWPLGRLWGDLCFYVACFWGPGMDPFRRARRRGEFQKSF